VNIEVDISWRLRIDQRILGNANIDFLPTFKSECIAVKGVTTNVNPRNVVGYLTQTLYIPALGGRTEISDRFIVINQIPKVLIFSEITSSYNLRFRFADPVGNCTIKVWEGVINGS
jgi:hypothetical protein